MEKLITMAREQKSNLWDILKNQSLLEKSGISGHTLYPLLHFRNLVLQYSEAFSRKNGMGDTFDRFIKEIQFRQHLEKVFGTGKDEEEAPLRRYENVLQIRSMLDEMERTENGADLAKLLSDLSTDDLLRSRAEKSRQEGMEVVSLMTVHGAKGLEFDHVFLVGFEENLMPHKNSQDDKSIDEERRLCYVAMTRARHHLTLSYSKERKYYSDMIKVEASRFFHDIPKALIQYEGMETEEGQPVSLAEMFRKRIEHTNNRTEIL